MVREPTEWRMVLSWVSEEMGEVDLGDQRLNRRLRQVLSDLGERPTASIPAACGGRKEMAAAYRLFDNDKVAPERILAPHFERTRQRIREQQVVLLVQDTTELDLTRPEQCVKDAGPLSDAARRGAYLHPLEAFTPDGTPLGAVWVEFWTRDDTSSAETQAAKDKKRRVTPIEDKESYRWLQGLRQAREVAAQCPTTTCVCVADSEADIYELFAEPRGPGECVHWLIRLCHDRALHPKAEEPPDPEAEQPAHFLRAQVQQQAVLFTHEISVRGRKLRVSCDQRGRRQPRQPRQAGVAVRAARVTLRPPRRRDRCLPPVTVNVVWVQEVHPPPGEEPVEWLLLTTLPIDTVDQVRQVIQYYCVRWMIEILFRTLKSGCRVEERRFEELDRELRCVAVYLIVAWRTLLLCRLGRSCPDLDCEAVFEPAEWKSVWVKVKGGTPPAQAPRLGEMVRLVAELGGYVNRPKRTDPPGPQTVWLGLQRMRDLAWAWDTFGPGATKRLV